MRVISGVLVTKEHSRQIGEVDVVFIAVPGEGSDMGDATAHKVTRVYEDRDSNGTLSDNMLDRDFLGTPAHLVHIREAKIEDKDTFWGTSREGEIDWLEINSKIMRHSRTGDQMLHISWHVHEPRSQILEIGFIVIGL